MQRKLINIKKNLIKNLHYRFSTYRNSEFLFGALATGSGRHGAWGITKGVRCQGIARIV
jgi:hypothetical protein